MPERRSSFRIRLGRAPLDALEQGARAGDLLIERVLAEGTFCVVHAAAHATSRRPAAVKVLRRRYARDPRVARRFTFESYVLYEVAHPNVVDLVGSGVLEDGRPWAALELLEGETLEAWLRRAGPVQLSAALEILCPLAQALDHVHALGLAHLDVKPENVILNRSQRGGRAKLIDFGNARRVHGFLDGPSPLAGDTGGCAFGTPAYLSPEQCRGGPLSTRADVYAFGVLAFEVVTGRLPFGGSTAVDLMLEHLHRPAPDPCALAPWLPEAAGRAIRAMLAKDPGARPGELVPVLDALRAAVADPRRPGPDPGGSGTAPWSAGPRDRS